MDENEYIPTPEEIKRECERFQASWTKREKWQRERRRPKPPKFTDPAEVVRQARQIRAANRGFVFRAD